MVASMWEKALHHYVKNKQWPSNMAATDITLCIAALQRASLQHHTGSLTSVAERSTFPQATWNGLIRNTAAHSRTREESVTALLKSPNPSDLGAATPVMARVSKDVTKALKGYSFSSKRGTSSSGKQTGAPLSVRIAAEDNAIWAQSLSLHAHLTATSEGQKEGSFSGMQNAAYAAALGRSLLDPTIPDEAFYKALSTIPNEATRNYIEAIKTAKSKTLNENELLEMFRALPERKPFIEPTMSILPRGVQRWATAMELLKMEKLDQTHHAVDVLALGGNWRGAMTLVQPATLGKIGQMKRLLKALVKRGLTSEAKLMSQMLVASSTQKVDAAVAVGDKEMREAEFIKASKLLGVATTWQTAMSVLSKLITTSSHVRRTRRKPARLGRKEALKTTGNMLQVLVKAGKIDDARELIIGSHFEIKRTERRQTMKSRKATSRLAAKIWRDVLVSSYELAGVAGVTSVRALFVEALSLGIQRSTSKTTTVTPPLVAVLTKKQIRRLIRAMALKIFHDCPTHQKISIINDFSRFGVPVPASMAAVTNNDEVISRRLERWPPPKTIKSFESIVNDEDYAKIFERGSTPIKTFREGVNNPHTKALWESMAHNKTLLKQLVAMCIDKKDDETLDKVLALISRRTNALKRRTIPGEDAEAESAQDFVRSFSSAVRGKLGERVLTIRDRALRKKLSCGISNVEWGVWFLEAFPEKASLANISHHQRSTNSTRKLPFTWWLVESLCSSQQLAGKHTAELAKLQTKMKSVTPKTLDSLLNSVTSEKASGALCNKRGTAAHTDLCETASSMLERCATTEGRTRVLLDVRICALVASTTLNATLDKKEGETRAVSAMHRILKRYKPQTRNMLTDLAFTLCSCEGWCNGQHVSTSRASIHRVSQCAAWRLLHCNNAPANAKSVRALIACALVSGSAPVVTAGDVATGLTRELEQSGTGLDVEIADSEDAVERVLNHAKTAQKNSVENLRFRREQALGLVASTSSPEVLSQVLHTLQREPYEEATDSMLAKERKEAEAASAQNERIQHLLRCESLLV